MEQAFSAHAVPQNVTNFEFHLVGDMTLKQFGYLAAGLGMAYLTFVFPGFVTSAPFLAWPLIIIFAALGTAFAFLPIQERPLDYWLAAFLKAIFRPTKLKYESKILPLEDPLFKKRLNYYLNLNRQAASLEPVKAVIRPNINSKIKNESAVTFSNDLITQKASSEEIKSFLSSKITAAPSPLMAQIPLPPASLKNLPNQDFAEQPAGQLPEKEQLKKTVELAKEAQDTQVKIVNLERQLGQIKSTAAQPGSDPNSYINQFEQVLGDLQKLNEHASLLSHELAVLAKSVTGGPGASSERVTQPSSVQTVALTTFPNVINGIVTDSKGSYVEGAIVVTHDKHGVPVRALKSNKLGQFIAATPLPNGIYTIAVEKEDLVFDTASVELTGQVLNGVLISARKLDPIIR